MSEAQTEKNSVAVVIGATGAIGGAFARQLAQEGGFDVVLATGRQRLPEEGPRTIPLQADVTDTDSLAALARVVATYGTLRQVIVASGILHDASGVVPEKHWGMLDPEAMRRVFAVNAIGPALVARHLLPLFPRTGRSVFAALSARVGSISDNRLGGWHSYRASKSALNMLIRTLAIELARRAPAALCVGLHPGTVDSRLSRPFQDTVAPGRLFPPDIAAAQLIAVIARLSATDSGRLFAWDGSVIDP